MIFNGGLATHHDQVIIYGDLVNDGAHDPIIYLWNYEATFDETLTFNNNKVAIKDKVLELSNSLTDSLTFYNTTISYHNTDEHGKADFTIPAKITSFDELKAWLIQNGTCAFSNSNFDNTSVGGYIEGTENAIYVHFNDWGTLTEESDYGFFSFTTASSTINAKLEELQTSIDGITSTDEKISIDRPVVIEGEILGVSEEMETWATGDSSSGYYSISSIFDSTDYKVNGGLYLNVNGIDNYYVDEYWPTSKKCSNPVFIEAGQSLTIYQATGPESS